MGPAFSANCSVGGDDEGDGTAMSDDEILVLQKVPSEANPKVRNHGEGPYYGLLLVESGYYRFHI